MEPHDWLRRLLRLYLRGDGCYPLMMGLDNDAWQALLIRCKMREVAAGQEIIQRRSLLSALNALRHDERVQLAQWLSHSMTPDAAPMHEIIASVSLAYNHLWQDLGLDSRQELRELMTGCFPPLVALNSSNMRWKKFFYRQRCLQQAGEIICRSPSCDECCERQVCFETDSSR